MNNKPGCLSHTRYKKPSRVGLRRGFLLAILLATAILQGCFLDRLVTLRSQACTFDEHFEIRTDRNLEIEFYDPVFLEKDMHLIWGAAPTTISRSDRGSTMRYLFSVCRTGWETARSHYWRSFLSSLILPPWMDNFACRKSAAMICLPNCCRPLTK